MELALQSFNQMMSGVQDLEGAPIPLTFLTSTSKPLSSSTSRATISEGRSPASAQPPGMHQHYIVFISLPLRKGCL